MDTKILSLVVCLCVASALQVHTNLHLQNSPQARCFNSFYGSIDKYMSIQNGVPTLALTCGANQQMTVTFQDQSRTKYTLSNLNKSTYIGFTDSTPNLKGISSSDLITHPEYDVSWTGRDQAFLNGRQFYNERRKCYISVEPDSNKVQSIRCVPFSNTWSL